MQFRILPPRHKNSQSTTGDNRKSTIEDFSGSEANHNITMQGDAEIQAAQKVFSASRKAETELKDEEIRLLRKQVEVMSNNQKKQEEELSKLTSSLGNVRKTNTELLKRKSREAELSEEVDRQKRARLEEVGILGEEIVRMKAKYSKDLAVIREECKAEIETIKVAFAKAVKKADDAFAWEMATTRHCMEKFRDESRSLKVLCKIKDESFMRYKNDKEKEKVEGVALRKKLGMAAVVLTLQGRRVEALKIERDAVAADQ